jgi:hypothetical protein
MDRPHDVGGKSAGQIDTSEHDLAQWEKNTHALMGVLGRENIIRGGREFIEAIPPDDFEAFSYYERWIAAMEMQLVAGHVLSKEEIDAKVQEMEGA